MTASKRTRYGLVVIVTYLASIFFATSIFFPSYAANPWTSENDCGAAYQTGAWGGAACTITVANTGDSLVIAGLMTLRSGSVAAMSGVVNSGPQNIFAGGLCTLQIMNQNALHGNEIGIYECKNIQAGNYNITMCTSCSNIPPASCASLSCGNYAIYLYALAGHAMKFWNTSGTNSGAGATSGSSNGVAFTGPIAVLGFSTTDSNSVSCSAGAGFTIVGVGMPVSPPNCYRSGNSNVFYAGSEYQTLSSSGTFTVTWSYSGSTDWSVEGVGFTFSNIIITTITTTLTVTGMVAPNLTGDNNWEWLIGLFFLLFPVAILDSMVVTPIGSRLKETVDSHVEGDTVIFTTLLGLFIGSIIGVMPTINALPLAFPFMFGVLFIVYWYVGKK